jgi:putative ABC transport system ATP-binding protein
MLQMNNISKVYQTEMVQTHALRDFNLNVNEGEFIAVTGPSGSGKTTFLNIAGMLEPFSEGDYILDGVNVGSLNENIEVPLRYRGIKAKERKRRIEQCLEQVGLASRAKHLPQQLSGGQQQRVAIARALAGEPRFLLADEPTGNLDSLMARQVMELLEQINRDGATIIMVTHDSELARRAPRNIQVVDGQLADFTLYQGAQPIKVTQGV